jgi:hypothetical protein
MIPRDWALVVDGINAATEGPRPGSAAPTLAEHEELLRRYG